MGYKDTVEFGLHVFQNLERDKAMPKQKCLNCNQRLVDAQEKLDAIKDFREKQTGNNRNCLQDT